jgi:hypothetical protein
MLQGCSHGTPALRDIPTPHGPARHSHPARPRATFPPRTTFPPRATHIPHPRNPYSLSAQPVYPAPRNPYSTRTTCIPCPSSLCHATSRGSGGTVSCSSWHETARGACRHRRGKRRRRPGARCKRRRRRGGNQGGPLIPGTSQRVRGVVGISRQAWLKSPTRLKSSSYAPVELAYSDVPPFSRKETLPLIPRVASNGGTRPGMRYYVE